MRFRESDTRHLHELEVAREREGRLASAHHEGVELVAFGIAEIGGVEFFTALSRRALAFAAERQRELVDAIDLGPVFRPEGRHHAVADRHRLAIIGKRDAEPRAAARTAPGDETIVRHEASHAQFAANLVIEFGSLLEIIGADGDVTDHDSLLRRSLRMAEFCSWALRAQARLMASTPSTAPPAPRPWPLLTPGLRRSPRPAHAARLSRRRR